ncbi:mechanosensitive ion channel domain-containing protein, partial [Fulvivirga sp.]
SAGIAGIIVGLAAQRLISNILAGFQIAITQPIRIDDVVIVENEWGRIEEITLTYVVINIWDKRRLVVPSTYFIEKPFQNWTRTTSELLGTVFIYTDYRMEVDVLRKQLTKILEATPLWDGKVNVIQVTDAKQSNMELRVLVSSKDASSGWDLRVHVREQLIAFLQKKYPEMLPKNRVELKQEQL